MQPVFIYALLDPQTGVLRYCGQTVDPDMRLRQHIRAPKKHQYYSAHWVRSLKALGLRPIMEILDVVPDSEADFWEREYIQNFRERGFDLTNFTSGGEGGATFFGKKHTPEARAKMSSASALWNGLHSSPKELTKAGTGQQGEKNHNFGKPGTMTGKKHTQEAHVNMSIAQRARQERLRLKNI